jgi:trk system potassium uptake protein TrkA
MIIGAGDIGMPLIHYLSERGHILAVIETSEKRCKYIANHADAAIFQGNGADPEIWKNVEAEKMDVLFAVTNKDDVNIKACEIAKKRFGIPTVIARAHQPENKTKLKDAGADVTICPAEETRRMFLNAFEGFTAETLCESVAEKFKVVIVTIPPNGSFIGKGAEQLDLSDNCKVTSVIRNGSFEFPSPSFVFKGGDRALLVGSIEPVEKAAEKLRTVEIT